MMALAIWAAIASLLGLIVSVTLYGHWAHRNPKWCGLDAQLEAHILANLNQPVECGRRNHAGL